ncbi:tail protein X [Halomonas getboli]|uniref:tail protein X n=1 Tax=Halomonas getboli TaxID=2935862 RepID=UPI001FFF20F8|nr:tail protein X [Halomonas getboli]MCK2185700.1 tail protein X [Halomonas getboli]
MRAIRTIAGDSPNGILWREMGRDDDAAEEAFWKANPGLAAYGTLLPSGVLVYLPEVESPRDTARKAVTAWD